MSDSVSYIEATPYRIAGMGMGTFAIFITTIIWTVIWIVTSPFSHTIKWFWRFWMTVFWVIVFVLLLYAEREPRYIYPQETSLLKVS